jgi:hypothetical protein
MPDCGHIISFKKGGEKDETRKKYDNRLSGLGLKLLPLNLSP